MTWWNPSTTIETVRVRVMAGTPIREACEDAARTARRLACRVSFEFNGLELTTSGDALEPLDVWRAANPPSPR